MATWAQFEQAAPTLAPLVRAAFAARKHATMATLRADGGPRISGTEVAFEDGEVFLGMGEASRKARDLLRDPRLAVHSPTRDPDADGRWAGEAKLSGTAQPVVVPPGYPPGALRMRLELQAAVFTDLTADGKRLRVRIWRPGRAVATMLRS